MMNQKKMGLEKGIVSCRFFLETSERDVMVFYGDCAMGFNGIIYGE